VLAAEHHAFAFWTALVIHRQPGRVSILRFSAVTGNVFGEGLYFVVPLIDSVQMMDIKIQKR
jgi:hypothetical protein